MGTNSREKPPLPYGKTRKSSTGGRRLRAVESFKSAADCIGPVEPGMSLFAITRGQFSMIDAVLHVLACTGPAHLTIWTWAIAEYELSKFTELRTDQRITSGTLIIDQGARMKNASLIADWKRSFGPESARYVMTHAKIATVSNDRFRVLLRGSMNLNFNPRFEQLDITEGGPDFDLVQSIENELPILSDSASGAEAYKASRVADAFDKETLALFSGVKTWAK